MSGFDENPFGEPAFADPFTDPSIQQVARNTTNNQRGLEDYNPFEDEPNSKSVSQNQPATLQPSNQTLPAYSASGQQYQVTDSHNGPGLASGGVTQISTAELQRRQDELEKKAAELERRENELRNNTAAIRRNNWPPVPDKCCFQPCFYHDINVDIPSEFQKIVQNLYYLWIFYACVMCLNVVGGMVVMFHTGNLSIFFLAIFYAFIFTPVSFLCWYRPAYKAFQNDSSINFMLFFFVFFFQLLIIVVQTIGISTSGYCGFILAIEQFDGTIAGTLVGLFTLSIAIAFATAGFGNLMMLTKIHSIYRSSGASIDKARAEFSTEFFRNQTVQNATQDAVRAAVDGQMGRNRY